MHIPAIGGLILALAKICEFNENSLTVLNFDDPQPSASSRENWLGR